MRWKRSVRAALLTLMLAIMDMTVFASESVTGEEMSILMEMEETDVNVAEGVIASGKDGNLTWVIDTGGKLTVEGTGDRTSIQSAWFPYRDQITSAEISVSGMTNANFLFDKCENMNSVDVSKFDTGNITDMLNMFYGCTSLANLDVSGFDTRNVTDMGGMFGLCSSLTNLDVSGFDTRNVTNMSKMFLGCTGLTNLDVSGFDTRNVKNMGGMFFCCNSLTNPDISGFDTRNVTYMGEMFDLCSSLTNLDVSGFNTGNVTYMGYMFDGCTSLTNLDVSEFDTGNVVYMRGMFDGCTSLTNLDVSGFDTRNVTDMGGMFRGCTGLTNLDVSGFDTHNVMDIEQIFANCGHLKSLDLSNFDLSQVIIFEAYDGEKIDGAADMFYGCDELVTIKTFKSAPKEAICNLPTYYIDESGNRTDKITAAFVSTTLTREGANIPTPPSTPVVPPSGDATQKVQDFVSRMYTVALGRDAEMAGLNDWTNRLITHEMDGAGIANGFIMSDEFKNRGLSNEDYVDTLYRTFFNREADQGGRDTWLSELVASSSRNHVLAGFVNSVEFDNLCSAYGIVRGTMQDDGSFVNPGIRSFVERCYTKVLGREGEKAGVEDWTNRIATGAMSAEDVAKSFFFSDEYTNMQTDNETFVETLYQTFMDRASDPAGKSDWVGRLGTGAGREEVLLGFSRSEEFAAILRGYGL